MKISLGKQSTVNALGNMTFDKVIKGGLSTSKDNKAVMNHILISGIAEDKAGYGIREIMANAWDANRKKPFDIHLPTRTEPWFSVRDYGLGISSKAYRGYVTLGESTKRNNANVVGCFGLGAKSPFAYLLSSGQTPEYTVMSIHKGVRRQYLHSLSEDCEPTASLMSEEDTTDLSGVEVSWPVLVRDVESFADTARFILSMFPAPHRDVLGETHWFRVTDDIEVSSSQNLRREVVVRMGCVGYPVPSSIHNWTGPGVLINIPIGSVSITASREALALDETTTVFLKKLLGGLRQQISEKLYSNVLSAPNICQGFQEIPERLRDYAPPITLDTSHQGWEKYVRRVGFHIRSTTRVVARVVEGGGEMSTFCGVRTDIPILRAAGYEVIDLTTFKLPPLNRDKNNTKKGVYFRKVLQRNEEGLVDEDREDVDVTQPFYYVFYRPNSRRRPRSYPNSGYFGDTSQRKYLPWTQLQEIINTLVPPLVQKVVVIQREDDPLLDHDNANRWVDYIVDNTTPPGSRQQLTATLQGFVFRKTQIKHHLKDLPALSVWVERAFALAEEVERSNKGHPWDFLHPDPEVIYVDIPPLLTEQDQVDLRLTMTELVEEISIYSINPLGRFALRSLNDYLSNPARQGNGDLERQDDLDSKDGSEVRAAA